MLKKQINPEKFNITLVIECDDWPDRSWVGEILDKATEQGGVRKAELEVPISRTRIVDISDWNH